MNFPRRRFLHGVFRLADLVTMTIAFGTAAWVLAADVYGLAASELLAMRVKIGNFVIFLLFLAVWHLCFRAVGLYRSRRLSSRWSEVVDVFKATSVGSLLLLNLGLVFQVELFTTQFVGLFWVLVNTATIGTRLVLRSGLEQARIKGRNLRDVLIVGTNRRALDFARRIEKRRELGYRVVGFVDDEWSGLERLRDAGESLVAKLDELPDYLRHNVVDEVMVALPIASFYEESSRILRVCEEQGIKVRYLSNFFNLTLAKARVEMFDNEPVLLLHAGPPEGWASAAKRVLDIVVSAAMLVVLAPLFAVVALGIKLTSPGPVFFVQERLGLNKRRFRLHKFRTMVPDAEAKLAEIEHLNEISGPVFKIQEDPRITPLGRFLRRTSIDELPQLFSVLRGDMSLVGPRPLPLRDYAGFDQDWHRRRFSVRPGLTCLWQVAGRNSIPFDRWMELDMEYIDRWSFWLDIKILARTIPAVLRGTGAS